MSTLSPNILVVSITLSLSATVLARTDCEGLQWRGGFALSSGFDTNPFAAAAVDHDGDGTPSVFVAGSGGASGVAFKGLVVLENGLWQPFGPSFSGSVASILRADLDGDGVPSFVVLGSLRLEPVDAGTPAYSMLEWNGAGWTPRAPVIAVHNAVVIDDDGDGTESLVIATRFPSTSGYPPVMRWTPAGWVDATPGFALSVGSYQANGAVLAAHDSDGDGRDELFASVSVTAGGTPVAAKMARWNGATWLASAGSAPPLALTNRVYSMCEADVDGDGDLELVASGWLPSSTPVGSAPQVVAFDGTSWNAVGGAFLTGASGTFNGSVYRVARAAIGKRGETGLYATGGFTMVDGQPAANIARWNGSTWTALGAGLPGGIGLGANHAMVGVDIDDDGARELVAIGSFVSEGTDVLNRAASWDGTSWSAVGPRASSLGLDGVSSASVVFDHDGDGRASIIAGGRFSLAGAIDARNMGAFDGTSWQAMANPWALGVDTLLIEDLDSNGTMELYAAGTTDVLVDDAYYARTIARFVPSKSGGSWEQIGGNFNSTISALEGYDHDGDGLKSLHAGGGFRVGVTNATGVVRWSGSAWEVVGTLQSQRFVNAIIAYDDDGDGIESLIVAVGYHDPDTVFPRALKWAGDAWAPLGSMTSGHLFQFQSFDHDGDGQESLFAHGHYRSGVNQLRFSQRLDRGAWTFFGPTDAPFTRPMAASGLVRFDEDGDGVTSLYLNLNDPFYGTYGAMYRQEQSGWNQIASDLAGGPEQAHVVDLENNGIASLYLLGAMLARTDTCGSSIAVIDVCGNACPADLDGDGLIDASDLSQLLASWGNCAKGSCPADLDGSGDVGAADVSLLFASWGACP